MIHDTLSHWRRIPGVAAHPVWSQAFIWLETQAQSAPLGYHELGQKGFLARVMEYPLKSRNLARFEMHRHTIDIQYTLVGGEGIEIASAQKLRPRNDYAEAKDVEFFDTPGEQQSRVDNLEGFFTVLFAGEPHMPQLEIPGIKAVRKVVIKVPVPLVGLGAVTDER
jgi:YhcH/YjgK/YiaL family protein